MTPVVSPQFIACGAGRDFYRITDKALEVFEVSPTIPPHNKRGSAAAVQVAAMEMTEPSSVVSWPKQGVLVIGKQNVFRYEPSNKRARVSAPIPIKAPFELWVDRERAGSFWVRVPGERSVHHYTPARAPTAAPVSRTQALPEFDGRLFMAFGDGEALYSTAKGLVRLGDAAAPVAAPQPAEPVTLVFPDAAADRYWTADATGSLGLWARTQSKAPAFTARVPGTVIDVAVEGDRVAVLSMQAKGDGYRTTVTVFSQGAQTGQLQIGSGVGTPGQPQLDLCLIPGRPWVAVGTRRWMQLLDWENPRLLAEW